MRRGVRIGVDFGQARIGVAVSNPEGTLVLPLETIARSQYGEDVYQLCDLVDEREAIEVIIGFPRHMSGKVSAMARTARSFGRELGKELSGVRIALVDERLSSRQAGQRLRELDLTRRETKSRVDATAAAIILEQALSIERHTGKPAGETIKRA